MMLSKTALLFSILVAGSWDRSVVLAIIDREFGHHTENNEATSIAESRKTARTFSREFKGGSYGTIGAIGGSSTITNAKSLNSQRTTTKYGSSGSFSFDHEPDYIETEIVQLRNGRERKGVSEQDLSSDITEGSMIGGAGNEGNANANLPPDLISRGASSKIQRERIASTQKNFDETEKMRVGRIGIVRTHADLQNGDGYDSHNIDSSEQEVGADAFNMEEERGRHLRRVVSEGDFKSKERRDETEVGMQQILANEKVRMNAKDTSGFASSFRHRMLPSWTQSFWNNFGKDLSPTQSPTQSPVNRAPPQNTPPPTLPPTSSPTGQPSTPPTPVPSSPPTKSPTIMPSSSFKPSFHPSAFPSMSSDPSSSPSPPPTKSPTAQPNPSPVPPTQSPTPRPSPAPTQSPTNMPSASFVPSSRPSNTPSMSFDPSSSPSQLPTQSPTPRPSPAPTQSPTNMPSVSFTPSSRPSDPYLMSSVPSQSPSVECPAYTPSIPEGTIVCEDPPNLYRTCLNRTNNEIQSNISPYVGPDEELVQGTMHHVLDLSNTTSTSCDDAFVMEELILRFLKANVGSEETFTPVCVFIGEIASYYERVQDDSCRVVESIAFHLNMTFVFKTAYIEELENESEEDDDDEGDAGDARQLMSFSQRQLGKKKKCKGDTKAECCSKEAMDNKVCKETKCKDNGCGCNKCPQPESSNIFETSELVQTGGNSIVDLFGKNFSDVLKNRTDYAASKSRSVVDATKTDFVASCSANRFTIDELDVSSFSCEEYVSFDCNANEDMLFFDSDTYCDDSTVWGEEGKFLPDDKSARVYFGWSVALDSTGNVALIGASGDGNSEIAADGGTAYILERGEGSWSQVAKLVPDDGEDEDNFGHSVALYGDTALVGAPWDSDKGLESGAVYVFRKIGESWAQEAKLVPSDGNGEENFGYSLSLNGDTALIGSTSDDDMSFDSGSAYVFIRNGDTWTQQAKLIADDGHARDLFGFSCSLYEDTALIGAPNVDDGYAQYVGAVYVFVRSGTYWTQTAKLKSSGGSSYGFGISVSLYETTALIGAHFDFEKGFDTGAAFIFIFKDNAWEQEAKLLRFDGEEGDKFGYSVSLAKDMALVGSYLEDHVGEDSGSAYIFKRDGTAWTQHFKLIPNDASQFDYFGRAVALSGESDISALIGAPINDDFGEGTGSAYLFNTKNQPVERQPTEAPSNPPVQIYDGKLLPDDAAEDDFFGFSVALFNDTVIVGAYGDDNMYGVDSGSAYIFVIRDGSWIQQAKILANDAAEGANFGFSVALYKNTALVGARDGSDNGPSSGAAYIFNREGDSWTQQAKLLRFDGEAYDRFGWSVSLFEEDRALVASPNDDDRGLFGSGSAYIFVKSGNQWRQEAKLLPTEGKEGMYFGYSVSLHGNLAIVSSANDNVNGADSGSAFIFSRSGSEWTQEAILIPNDGGLNHMFGYRVALYDNVALIGAPYANDNGLRSGSAYIFEREGDEWKQEKLLRYDGTAYDRFGSSVSLFENKALIGSRFDDISNSYSGSAYIFRQVGSEWVEYEKIVSRDGASFDYFGQSVSMDRDNIVVGAYGNDDYGSNSGSAYVIPVSLPSPSPTKSPTIGGPTMQPTERTVWGGEDKLLPDDDESHVYFGFSVSLDNTGNVALVGAPGDDTENGVNGGSAYIFTLDGEGNWSQADKLIPNDGTTHHNFGHSVSLYDDTTVIIGAPLNGGAAYVFEIEESTGSWTEQAKLQSLDGIASDSFGWCVSLFGNTALIGSPNDDVNGNNSGSAFIFVRDGTTFTWSQQAKLVADDLVAYDSFGFSCFLYGDTAVIGAPFADENGEESGAVYIFVRSETSWIQSAKLIPDDGFARDAFGYSVSLFGEDTLLIGAPYDDDNGYKSGAAYVFIKTIDGWIQQRKLLRFDGQSGDRFGYSVSLAEDMALVSSYLDQDVDYDNGLVDKGFTGSAYAFARIGTKWTQQYKFLAYDQPWPSYFGMSVALSKGNHYTSLIGAPFDDVDTIDSGSAFIFSKSFPYTQAPSTSLSPTKSPTYTTPTESPSLRPTQQLTGKLLPNDGASEDYFGRAVSLSNGTALVGAAGDDMDSGAAYIFVHHFNNTWTQQAKLRVEDAIGSNFGQSVALFDNTALIGSPNSDANGPYSGGAYIFVKVGSSWTQEAKLTREDGEGYDQFGWSVALFDDRALVGSPGDNVQEVLNCGSAYVFVHAGGTWVQEDKLVANDCQEGMRMGQSVSLYRDLAIVGAPNDDVNGVDSGSAYIFSRNGSDWTQIAKLVPSDGGENQQFGYSVALFGNTALVGAPYAPNPNLNGHRAGAAYIFERNGATWEEQKLVRYDGEPWDYFGYSVSLYEDKAVVGSVLDFNDAGSAYVFHKRDNLWLQHEEIVSGDSADLDNVGISVCIDRNDIIVGAASDDDYGESSGSAYVFQTAIPSPTSVVERKIIPLDLASRDIYGWSVALDTSGQSALIGSPAANLEGNGIDAGTAYIYTQDGNSTWIQENKLIPDDGIPDAWFGFSVSLFGDTALVGAPWDSENAGDSGAAYVFRRLDDENGIRWTQEEKLLSLDGSGGDLFGFSLALYGNTALVCSPNDGDMGSCYVFIRNGTTWSHQFKIVADDGSTEDLFGYSCSLYGDTALIGAPNVDRTIQGFVVPNAGAVYVFVRNGVVWTQTTKLESYWGITFGFGASVSLFGTTAIIGANFDYDFVKDYRTGAAFIFVFDGSSWEQEAKLRRVDAEEDDQFGISVSISEDVALVGSLEDSVGEGSGAAYIFERAGATWRQRNKIIPESNHAGDNFARAVALSKSASNFTALMGAPYTDENGENSGAAYVFESS